MMTLQKSHLPTLSVKLLRFSQIEINKTNKVVAEISQDSKDPIASVAMFYTQKKRFQPRGKV